MKWQKHIKLQNIKLKLEWKQINWNINKNPI